MGAFPLVRSDNEKCQFSVERILRLRKIFMYCLYLAYGRLLCFPVGANKLAHIRLSLIMTPLPRRFQAKYHAKYHAVPMAAAHL